MGQQASAPKITSQDRAIFQMKQQRDRLKQYQKRLTVLVDKQSSFAREAIKQKEVEKAKFYLRSKKQQESTISKTYQQLDNLENLINTIEFKLIEKDVIYGLKEGNKVLNKLNQEMKIEKIDKLMDDLEENRVQVDEVSNALGNNLTNKEELEVDEELEKLEKEVNGSKEEDTIFPEAPKEELLPDVPSEDIVATPPKETEPEISDRSSSNHKEPTLA
ncbi:uncharacterized protein PRCAT00006303001 [Priceomyces carsonii]|uniref:uncharacterized protein n=1 Tax=Priceomyces carsonii TaxID=28549 RepID=UPI002ED9B07B|nr:unnamed protein product [Priceomyces carsonii]